METRSPRITRKQIVGKVVGAKSAKTITVEVERLIRHPKYEKYIKRTSRYQAHDEEGQAKAGDKVELMECRPISKTKHFRLVRVIGA